jgi:DNA adenine methylase
MIEEGTITARPFLKWVGGKSKLMPQLLPLVPKAFNNYYEPFLGGGAFYFALPNVKKAFLNDINKHLVAAFEHIRDDLDVVINELMMLQNAYYDLTDEAQKEYFLERRAEYNRLQDSSIRKTALLIFLNKTCFNGMYRENSKGEFNVPFGNHRTPPILDEKNLRSVSLKLRDAEFTSGSYDEVVKFAKKGDFIYFDPPYFPLTPTASFTSYHASGFAKSDQEKLRDTFAELDKRGCYVMLSNSATDAIREFYKKYRIVNVQAARAINSVGSKRGKVTELVIMNY